MAIQITDVTLRDGLQMEGRTFETAEKLMLLDKLEAIGYARLEITSFVNPKWVPQFTDAEAFCREAAKRTPRSEWMAFVPNEKGLERLLPFPIPWVSCFIAATETFNRKNVNQGIDDTLSGLQTLVTRAHAEGRKIRIYVSTVFGCPYEGIVPVGPLTDLLSRVASLSPDEIALSDTIGVAVPSQIADVVARFSRFYPIEKTALHFHNTYGLATAAALAGLAAGVTKFDGATGGVGGCPYAKGATGNVATEDLVYAFFRESASPAPAIPAVRDALSALKGMGATVRSRLFEILEKGGTLYAIQ